MGHKILCIEDNPDNMTLLKRVLESRGYTLIEARTGLEGVDRAESDDIKLVLLDINLPDIDGYEVAQRLRGSANPNVASLPIIAITANALKGDAEKALSSGCNLYMSKPINLQELWSRVETFVGSNKPK
jgi:CheY-like chemotaxis protein